jgi:cellulose synthase operon protein C
MSYKIKWWFLLKFTVLLVALGVTVHLVHARQVKRQFGAYLDQADKAKDADNPGREAEYLDRYLKAVPGDIAVRERLARLYCRTATRPRELENAYYALEDVLNRDPNRDELRRYAVEFATGPKVGLFKEARGHVEALLAKGPDADLEATRGKCLLAEGKFADAAEAYRKSYELKSTLVDSYAVRAGILRRHLNQSAEADKVIDAMLAANEKDHRAYLVAAEYWQTFAPLDRGADAAAAVAKAKGIAPEERDVLLMSADFARLRARNLFRDGKPAEAAAALDEARNLLDLCTQKHPSWRPTRRRRPRSSPRGWPLSRTRRN